MMFNNDLYIRKFPLYESIVVAEFKALIFGEDRLLKEPLIDRIRRVFCEQVSFWLDGL